MSERFKLTLIHDSIRRAAHQAVDRAPLGYTVEIYQPTRTSEQSARFHAAVRDVSKQVEWHGKMWGEDVWKTMFVATLFKQEVLPSLNNDGLIVINAKTSRLTKSEMADLIDLCYSFGLEHGVEFKDV